MMGMLLGVFTASLLGSVHCAGMCGPLVVLAGGGQASAKTSGMYNAGRILSYLGLGLVAGYAGSAVNDAGGHFGWHASATLIAAMIMFFTGVWWVIRGTHVFKKSPAIFKKNAIYVHRLFSYLFERIQRIPALPRAFFIGTLTPLLPCGWLYLYVLAASGTGSALKGALVMLVFGLGNLPVLMTVGTSLGVLRRRFGDLAPLMSGLVLIFSAILTLTLRDFSMIPKQEASHGSCHGQP